MISDFDMERDTETPRLIAESDKRKYISLKEAADIAGYSPDYIGQLIRAGKMEGQQVYTNVSWVTTEKALRTYLAARGKSEVLKKRNDWRHDPRAYIRWALYGVIVLLGCILLLLAYIFFVSIDHALTDTSIEKFDAHTYGL